MAGSLSQTTPYVQTVNFVED